jgi:hypothetical protein
MEWRRFFVPEKYYPAREWFVRANMTFPRLQKRTGGRDEPTSICPDPCRSKTSVWINSLGSFAPATKQKTSFCLREPTQGNHHLILMDYIGMICHFYLFTALTESGESS